MSTLQLLSMDRPDSINNSIVLNHVSATFDEVTNRINLSCFVSLSFEPTSLKELCGWQPGLCLSIPIKIIKLFVSINQWEKEEKMEKYYDTLGIPVDVSIGQVDLSLADLLSLEKGQCIVSKLSPQSTVALIIAGEIIAHAAFEVEGEMILLKINEIFLHANRERSDNSKEALI